MTEDSLFEDFIAFSKAQLASGDIDPAYPVLRMRARLDKCTREQALWRSLLHVTWYNLGSAETCWKVWKDPTPIEGQFVFPTGVERRGFRGPAGGRKAQDFVNSVLSRAEEVAPGKGLCGWLDSVVRAYGVGERGWRGIREELERCAGAGSWASYKWADLLRNVHDFRIAADSILGGGDGIGSGPVAGFALVFRVLSAPSRIEQRLAMERCINSGAAFAGLDQFETCLCDFNSLFRGHYYVGHDIDAMMTQLAEDSGLWEARRMALPRAYLGEMNGWRGVEAARKKIYQDLKAVVVR